MDNAVTSKVATVVQFPGVRRNGPALH